MPEDVNTPSSADASTPRVDLTAIGLSGLNRFGYYIKEELLKELDGQRGIRVYREMSDNDPIIGAILFAVEMIMRKVDWTVKPASDAPEDLIGADLIDQAMKDMEEPWAETVAEALSMLRYGHSVHEKCFKICRGPEQKDLKYKSKYSDGRVGWRKFAIRSQETLQEWNFDDEGNVVSVTQVSPPDYRRRTIPREKFLLFRTTSHKGNPLGRSVLRNAYRPWYFKKNIENVEGIGIERDLTGLPVMYVPPSLLSANATPQEKQFLQTLKDIVQRVKRDEQEGIVLPMILDEQGKKLLEFQLVASPGSRQFDTDKIINRYDHRIAVVLLADFILLGTQSGGLGQGTLGGEKTDLFCTAISTWLDTLARPINDEAIPELLRLNGLKCQPPQLTHSGIEKQDIVKLGQYLAALTSCGMPIFPNPDIEQHLLDLGGLPSKANKDL